MARWLGGDPSGFDDLEASELDTHERRSATVAVPYAPDWFNYGVFTAMVWASAGDREVVARAVWLSRSVGLDITTTHNAVPLAVAEAAQAIVDHDEAAATRIIADLLAAHPLPDRTVEIYLRRFLAIPYLCSPEARHRYDAEALGPAHRVARDASRALLGARRAGLAPPPGSRRPPRSTRRSRCHGRSNSPPTPTRPLTRPAGCWRKGWSTGSASSSRRSCAG